MATTQEAEEDDDHSEDDMVTTSTASDSTAGSVAPSRASDRDDERLAPCTSGDSDGEGVMSSSVSDREEEGIMSSSVSDSEEEGMTSSRVSGREDEGIASSRVGDNEEDGMTSSRASESEDEGTASLRAGDGECGRLVPYTESERSEDDRLVPYTDESESEDELIRSSRPAANGGGPAAPKDDAHAVRRASHRPVESQVAQTKDKDYSVEKQRASKSVPLVSRFVLDLYDLGDANESAADTLSPPSSRLDGRGGGHAKSARKTPILSGRRILLRQKGNHRGRPMGGGTELATRSTAVSLARATWTSPRTTQRRHPTFQQQRQKQKERGQRSDTRIG